MGRFRAPRGLRAGGAEHDRLRRARARVPAQRLQLQGRRRHVLDDDPGLLQADGAVVLAAGLAAVVGDALIAVVVPGAVPDAPPPAGDRPLRDRRAARAGRVLRRARRVRREPVPDDAGRRDAVQRRRPGPAADASEHDVPPADALHRVHADGDPVRVRGRRADHRQARAPSGSATPGASRLPPGCASGSASSSARAGPTPSSGGAATGVGTRSRTRR